jgi:diguanylate cyclase (GGDEF)-like protein
MIDLDRFKTINDTHGHVVGDAVLKEAALRMNRVIRRYDAFGRYAGDEFLLVSTSPNRVQARATAARLRDAVAAGPIRVGSESLAVTVSIGIFTPRSRAGRSTASMPPRLSARPTARCTSRKPLAATVSSLRSRRPSAC